jgi:MFS family permease
MDGTSDPLPQQSASDGCPLPATVQTRNLWIYALTFWMQYLASPVTYIGSTQASLTKELGASDVVSNLSATLYFAMAFLPVLLAKSVSQVSFLRQLAVTCFASNALAMAGVVVMLIAPVPAGAKIAAVVVQSAFAGAAMPAAAAYMWEAIARGVAEGRRGYTLGITFGAGPLLGVLGAVGSQVVLTGELVGQRFFDVVFPYNFAALYGLAAPMIGLCAFLAARLDIPIPAEEKGLPPRWGPAGGVLAFLLNMAFLIALLAGSFALAMRVCEVPLVQEFLAASGLEPVHIWLAFFTAAVLAYTANLIRQMLADRLILTVFIVAVLLYTCNLMYSNMTLYIPFALGRPTSEYLGWQNVLRFGFKSVAGVWLGWLLARTNPKAGVLATGAFFLLSQVWAITFTGPLFLLAFGIYGMGELIGVYAPNYMLAASPARDIRRNMAFATLVSLPTSLAGILFGGITDYFRAIDRAALGFPVSFAVCGGLVLLGILLALVGLPWRPQRHNAPESKTL